MIERVFCMEEKLEVLKQIRTDEMREEYVSLLNRWLTEYEWFTNTEDPLKSILTKIENPEISEESKESLKRRARLIKKEEYRVALERNIAAYTLAIKEYDAKKKGQSLSKYDIAKGFLKKDPEIKGFLNDIFLKSRAERNGLIMVSPVNMELQSKKDVLEEIFEVFEFINISKPEVQETSLIPVNLKENELYEKVREMFDECIKENGVSKQQIVSYTVNDSIDTNVSREIVDRPVVKSQDTKAPEEKEI